MPMETMYPAAANSVPTLLSGLLSQSATTIHVVGTDDLPDGPNLATIGAEDNAEVIQYTAKTTNSLTGVTRGFSGTQAQIWPEGTQVYRAYTSHDHDAFLQNIDHLEASKAGTTGDASTMTVAATPAATRAQLVTGDTLQTLTGKLMRWYASFGDGAWADFGTTDTTIARGDHTHSAYATLDSDGKVDAAQLSTKSLTVTASRALALADAGRCVDVSSLSALTVTIPTDATAAFPVDTEIEIAREGSGTVTIAAASGVTIRAAIGTKASYQIANQYAMAVLKKKGADDWRIAGDLL